MFSNPDCSILLSCKVEYWMIGGEVKPSLNILIIQNNLQNTRFSLIVIPHTAIWGTGTKYYQYTNYNTFLYKEQVYIYIYII